MNHHSNWLMGNQRQSGVAGRGGRPLGSAKTTTKSRDEFCWEGKRKPRM